MKERFKRWYSNSTLATKIRCSYFILLIPVILLLFYSFYNIRAVNKQYEYMLNSAVVASEFNMDFKKDFDYETYLVIVGNKNFDESILYELLNDAGEIVEELEGLTDSPENAKRLEAVKNYLSNLETYTLRIEGNLVAGDKYSENMEIWENDVQIVTSLLRENMFQYIYYEVEDIQKSHIEYQKFNTVLMTSLLIVFVGILILIILISYKIPLSITRPIRKLSEVTDQVAKGNLAVRADVKSGVEVGMLSDSLNTMIDKINELLEQVTKEQTRLRKAEFELLQTQINPHFLYNTLDTIVWLAESGEQKKVADMVVSLSDFFRASLSQGKDIVSIKEELQHVRSYLEIQQMRYQDILQYEIDVTDELYGYSIPKITLQPLVENALYHGIKNKRGMGMITIKGIAQKEHFVMQIEDNGRGMTGEQLQNVIRGINEEVSGGKKHYGLYNVNERIRLNFGEEYGIEIESIYTEKTVVSVKLPYMGTIQE